MITCRLCLSIFCWAGYLRFGNVLLQSIKWGNFAPLNLFCTLQITKLLMLKHEWNALYLIWHQLSTPELLWYQYVHNVLLIHFSVPDSSRSLLRFKNKTLPSRAFFRRHPDTICIVSEIHLAQEGEKTVRSPRYPTPHRLYWALSFYWLQIACKTRRSANREREAIQSKLPNSGDTDGPVIVPTERSLFKQVDLPDLLHQMQLPREQQWSPVERMTWLLNLKNCRG